MKKHQQSYKTPARKCDRCEETRNDVEKVSDHVWPGGGNICGPCIVPATAETNRIGSRVVDQGGR